MSPASLTKYSNAQASSLAQFIDETPNAVGKALVTFDRFLTVEQAASMLEGAEKIDTIYMWMPNQEGRAIIYLCRRKTLCFSCRDIRRHPCPCANTRANIGLSPCGEGENIFYATAYNISRSSAREVAYPDIHLSALGRRCPPWKKPTSSDYTPQQNRKNSFARPSAAAGSSTIRPWPPERTPILLAAQSVATIASSCCPG